MTTTIFYYTGTGNSLWTARKIAGSLDQADLISISRGRQESSACASEHIGLVFPVHIWGVPPPVIEFLQRWKADAQSYLFAVAVNAGQVAATLIQLQKILHKQQRHLSCGFSIDLPSNYIVWRGSIAPEQQQKKFAAALEKIESIAMTVCHKEERLPEKGPFWQNPFFSWMYRRSFPHIGNMDKAFFADEKCSGCGICEKICPAGNIMLARGKPGWQHRCEQCFACIQWCPEEAIQYGKSTSRKKRYHHPDISLKDILARVSAKNC